MRALTRAISRGDDRAFERFYNTWFEPAYTMARTLTRRDESFCLDVVQDAMLKAARSMKPIDTDEQLAAWVRRVVHTAALDRLRAERRRLARERDAATDTVASRRLARTDERIAWLHAQIDALPSEDRSLLLFRFARSRTIEATADAHALTPGAAHGRIRRALRRLRDAGKDQTP
ncbi:MAG: RNA polymerase sigma factor [Phycisphaerales bacterium JB059]